MPAVAVEEYASLSDAGPWVRGDTWSFELDLGPLATYYLGAGNGSVEGHIVTLTLKPRGLEPEDDPADDSAAVLKHSETFPAGADADAGIGRVTVPVSKTSLVEPNRYDYDLEYRIPAAVSGEAEDTVTTLELTTGGRLEPFEVARDWTRVVA